MKPFQYICAAMLMIFINNVSSQQFLRNIKINDDPSGKSQRAPIIQVDEAGTIYIAWIDARNNSGGDIYLSKSTDGGKTFSPNKIVYAGGAINSNFQRTGYFSIDHLGRLHFVWMENKINNQPDIFYSKSIDGGITFSNPISVSGDSSIYAQDFPSIATDSLNNVYICFLNSQEVQQKLSTNVQLYFTKSTDGGNTFSKPIRATNMPNGIGGTCECCRTSMAVAPNGHVYIAFRSNINDRRDIFIARSLDGGKTFDTAIPAASYQWIISACPVTGPSITLDRNETAHVVWRDNRPSSSSTSIYYTTLQYGESACQPDKKISDSPRQTDYPTITIKDKIISVVYQDKRNDVNDIFYTYSIDGGNTFSPCKKLSDEPTGTSQEFADCVFDKSGNRFAVWQDARNDDGDIYFAKDTIRLQSQTTIDNQLTEKSITLSQNYPNPFASTATIHVNLPLLLEEGKVEDSPWRGEVSFKIYDLFGRAVLDLSNEARTNSEIKLNRSQFPSSGVYIYSLKTMNETITRKMLVR